MTKQNIEHGGIGKTLRDSNVAAAIAIVGLQSVAALFFLIDSVDEVLGEAASGISWGVISECLIAAALLAGVVFGARQTRKLMYEAKRRDQALAVAKGALSELMKLRFAEWQLSSGEAEVALFAIKGCSVSEIAKMRNTATGTVRSQLSQIYGKAGVTSQSMLIAQLIEELV